jgi:hypothetical protein
MKNHWTSSSFTHFFLSDNLFFYQGKFSADEAAFGIDATEKVCWDLSNKRKTFGFKGSKW